MWPLQMLAELSRVWHTRDFIMCPYIFNGLLSIFFFPLVRVSLFPFPIFCSPPSILQSWLANVEPIVDNSSVLSAINVEEDGSTLFVKNLNFATTEETLRELFEAVVPVRSVTIGRVKDGPVQSRSLGYAFVEFLTKENALTAIKQLQVTTRVKFSLLLLILYSRERSLMDMFSSLALQPERPQGVRQQPSPPLERASPLPSS